MSLIADSLKKAVKEKSAPKWETNPEINPVGKREPVKRLGLSRVFSVLLLIVLPTAVLLYLISIGAFSLKKTPVTQKPDLPVSIPVEEARVSPPLKPAPEVVLEKPVAVSPTKPTKKASLKKKAVALTTSDKPLVSKKEKTVVKKVVPSSSPEKESGKPEKPVITIPKEKSVALSSPSVKPTKPVVPKTTPEVAEKKILSVPPAQPTEKTLTEAIADLEKKLVVPEEIPSLKPSEVEIPDHEIATNPESLAKPSDEPIIKKSKVTSEQGTPVKPEVSAKLPPEPVLEKAEVSPGQETVPPVADKKIIAVLPTQLAEKPLAKATPDLEKKVVVPEETPRPKPEVAEIPDQKVAAKSEEPVQPTGEPVLEKPQASPTISDAVKGNREVASLPSSSAKPEISRVDPRSQENVFNSSDYYFNRAIFFQQAGDWQKALDNYSKSEELDPNNPDTYNNKGVVLKEMGKYDQALDEFLRAVFLDAGYAKAYNNIGVVYFMQKNYPEAIKHYLKAIDINPTNLEAFNNLAIIYKKQKESDKARGVLNRALSLNPDHPGTNYNLAVLYEENSEIKPALHFYRRFIELGARNYPSLVLQVKEHLEGMKPQ